jgi:glycosyltransferase involved in cell wall biosynthesis
MKLIIQIPCKDEADTLPLVVRSIPRHIPGVDTVEVLVVDDGSVDGTADVALDLGVEHVVRHARNKGLAAAFASGIDACLRLGADIIVNTDGDNQYRQEQIPDLIRPILEGHADMVIGDRQVDRNPAFGRWKSLLNQWGSAMVRTLSGTRVQDAPSGFRAYTREAAARLNVLSSYTYTLETLIQAGAQRMAVEAVPIGTNPKLRRSRLFKNFGEYIRRSAATILRTYATYKPLKVFLTAGAMLAALGAAGVLRFLYFYLFDGNGAGHVQSLVVAGALLVVGFQVGLIGLLADLIAANRRLAEETLYRVRRLEADLARERREEARSVLNALDSLEAGLEDNVEGEERPSVALR